MVSYPISSDIPSQNVQLSIGGAVYFLQSLDKTALSYAAVFGLIEDTNLVGDEYSWLGAIVYVAQLVWQPVVAVFLVKLPTGKFLATMVFCWLAFDIRYVLPSVHTNPRHRGAVLCGMTATSDYGGLMATRFLLGSFEACVAPTFIAIIQMWYRRGEQTVRNAAWYAQLGVVNIVSPQKPTT